jgi:hypothetical protein
LTPRYLLRRKKEEGRRKKEEGRRKKEEGRRKKEEGRRKKEEGRRKKEDIFPFPFHLIRAASFSSEKCHSP